MEVSCPQCSRGVRLSSEELASKARLKAVRCGSCGSNFDARLLIASGSARVSPPEAPLLTAQKSPTRPLAHSPTPSVPAPPTNWLKKKPATIGQYQILDEINRGGMGIVYKAIDPQLKRHVAIKVLLAGEGASDSDVLRFKREAQATARLQHPNIVPIYAVGEHEGKPYFVMDFIEGRTAKELNDRGEMTPRLALKIIEGAADALHHAHLNGVFHRDVKPANIIVDDDERPQLMDFGLARRADEDLEITQSGTTMGTPSYMSPEQAEGHLDEVDARSDVYSVGACLYELLAGRPPFEGETTLGVLRQIIDDPPVPPRKLNPSINRDVETICLKCLEKKQSARYASARDLADDIRRFNAGEAIAAKPLGSMGRFWRGLRRHKELSIAALAMLLSGLGVIAYAYSESRANTRKLVDDRQERFGVALHDGIDGLDKARAAIQTFGAPQIDFERAVASARETLSAAERHLRQAEALFPDNPDLKSALEKLRRIELEADVKRYSVKARLFLHPPDSPPGAAPVEPNFAGAEFAAQEAVTRDPKNETALALLHEARGIRKVNFSGEIRSGANLECEIFALKIRDAAGHWIAHSGASLGAKLGLAPVRDAELEPGFYIVSFVRKGLAPQQATFILKRDATEAETLLNFPLDAKEENMAQIAAGDARAPDGKSVKVPAFSIDRYEYPNHPGSEPQTGLSLLEARQACQKSNKHLCSAAQWTRACAGDAGHRFPYGDSYASAACATGFDGNEQTRPFVSGLFTRCKTADGVYDMAGNAAEWVDGGNQEILAGGDWTGSIKTPDLSGSCRTSLNAEDVNRDRRGFRCCK